MPGRRMDWRKAKTIKKDDGTRKTRPEMRADRYLEKIDGDKWLTPAEKKRRKEREW